MRRYSLDMSKAGCLRLWIFAGLMSSILAPAHALTWEKTSLDLALGPATADLIAEFPFKNDGTAPATISELKSSCGCAVPTVESKVIPAGATGVIRVVYTPGDRVGQQSAQLVVRTDEKGVSPALLRLRVNIQQAVSLTPRLVRWSQTDGSVARVIEIKQLGDKPVRILEVKPVSDALSVELKPGAEAGSWQLILTPKSTEQPSTTKVEILTEVGDHKTTYSVFGVVR